MTVVYNSTTNVITVNSSLLTSFVGYDTVVLEASIGCTSTYPYTVTIEEGDVVDSTYTIVNSTFFETTDTLADGVYSFKLTVTTTSNVITTRVNCLFIDNETGCNVADLAYASKCDTLQLKVDYYLLANATDCECDCTPLCALYKSISEYESDGCGGCVGCSN